MLTYAVSVFSSTASVNSMNSAPAPVGGRWPFPLNKICLAPDPAGGAYSAPQTPYLDFMGLILGREGKGGGKGRGEERGRNGFDIGWGGEGAGLAPKLKLGPQNYFPGAGANKHKHCQ